MTTVSDRFELEVHPVLAESQIHDEVDASHLLYARGFLLTRKPPASLPGEHWDITRIGGRFLAWDRRNGVVIARGEQHAVALVGRFVHVGLDSSEQGRVASFLLRQRTRGRAEYLQGLEALAGRYVALDSGPDGTRVQSDATSMRAVFFSSDAEVVAGHENMVADHLEQPCPSPFNPQWQRANRAYAAPGRMTTWADVYLLTPNTELDVDAGAVTRVGPRPASEAGELNVVAEQVLTAMRVQLQHLLSGPGELQVSLTAGLDSRVTLAALRPYLDRCNFFTYAIRFSPKEDAVRDDVSTATELARRFGLKHQVIEVESRLAPGALRSVMNRNATRQSGQILGKMYRDLLPPDTVHLRSNLYEIGRAYYRTRPRPPMSPDAMSILLCSSRDYAPETPVAFAEFAAATAFDEVAGFDPYDLFYWEHRMSSWLNAVLAESDIAHDTYIMANSRSILGALLSLPLEDRRSGAVFDRIVGAAWPELFSVPVNGKLHTALV